MNNDNKFTNFSEGDSLSSVVAKKSEVLCAKLANFSVNVDFLKAHFEQQVKKTTATLYRDNLVDYQGWAVTSRDGSVADGVKRISTKSSSEKTENSNRRGVIRTPICFGYLDEVMDALQGSGLSPYRARFMQLDSEGMTMPFHTDAASETWRLHIPLETNPDALFQWQLPDGSIESVHLPADGSAWLVRVDIMHRAINSYKGKNSRVHLLMGLGHTPKNHNLNNPILSYERSKN